MNLFWNVISLSNWFEAEGKMKFFLATLSLFQLYLVISAEKACEPSITTTSGSLRDGKSLCRADLIFEDNFDTFDFSKWQHENTLSGGGNWEFQWYGNNRTNSFVKEGRLHIRPSLLSDQTGEGFLSSGVLNIHGGAPADECTNPAWYGCERAGNPQNIINPLKSARIRTVNTFRFKYGKVEVSAKMPAGDWLWPAIWLLPANNEYGTWPASGEIDLVESRGNKNLVANGVNIGSQQAGQTLHYGPYPSLNGWEKAHFNRQYEPGYDTTFKRYQLEWTPDHLIFSIDDVEMGRIVPSASGFWGYGDFATAAPGVENPWRYGSKMAPFDQEFYLIMNLAVGGTNYFPDGASNPDPKPWDNNSPTAMKDFYSQKNKWLSTWNLDANEGESASLVVDYVRVWSL